MPLDRWRKAGLSENSYYVEPDYINPSDIRGDGWIPCFSAQGDAWSFVGLGEDGFASEVREKRRISKFATIGLYWFRSAELFESAYEEYYAHASREEKGERYVAPLYNQLIQSKGRKVTISDIPLERVHALGTPEEVRKFQPRDNQG